MEMSFPNSNEHSLIQGFFKWQIQHLVKKTVVDKKIKG